MKRNHLQTAAVWGGGLALLLGMPLLGVWLAGQPVAPFLEMPPRTLWVARAPFSWLVFWGMAAGLAAVTIPFAVRIVRSARTPLFRRPVPAARPRRFPAWGWLAVAVGAATWCLAWTRFPWFRAGQPFTFTPLWLSYIVVMNALAYRRTGRSPLTHRTRPYLALFPISAVFWWFFEYLNRFVQNWHYVGIEDLSAAAYVLRAMLPFATVLPAFVATRAWLASYPSLSAGLGRWVRVPVRHPRRLAGLGLAAAAASLAGIGVWPEILFPLLWISPLIVLAAVRALTGAPTLLGGLGRGDWRPLFLAAAAALVCGFFWELWNLYSLERWIYLVPYVSRFHLFEMPLLGYAGYLPFGVECALAAELAGLDGKEEGHEETPD